MLKATPLDVAGVKAQTEAVSQKFYAASEQLYKEAAAQAQAQQQAQGGPEQNAQPGNDDNVVDADYTEAD